MGNEKSRLPNYLQNQQVRVLVPEVNLQEIVMAQRTVSNTMTEIDLYCIEDVEENIIKGPQFVWKNCELRIFLDKITLILQAGKCQNVVECFIEHQKFYMIFVKRTWRKKWYDLQKGLFLRRSIPMPWKDSIFERGDKMIQFPGIDN